MWGTVVIVTAGLWSLAGVFLIYAASSLLVHWDWKQFVIACLLWAGISIAEIVFAGISE